MTDFNFDNSYDGDSEEREHLTWNEFDWHKYIHTNQKEIEQFATLYKTLRVGSKKTIDDIARELGWIVESDNNSQETPEALFFEATYDPSEFQIESAPSYELIYTIHKHPMMIICLGFLKYINYEWERFIVEPGNTCSAVIAHQFDDAMSKIQLNGLMGVYAIETTEFALATSHFKTANAFINQAINALNPLYKSDSKALELVKFALFDMREIFIKAMQDCRDADSPSMPGDFE